MSERDALTLLKADHERVSKLFGEFNQLGERAVQSRAEICREICHELTVHALAEESAFYPRVRNDVRNEKDEILEATEEHHLIKVLIAELEPMSAEDESFVAKMQVLQEQVEHHVHEEETEMFPAVRKHMSHDVLVELAGEIDKAKADIERHADVEATGRATKAKAHRS